MITVINEYTGMSADKPRKEIIASSTDELDDVVAGHGSIGYSIEDATLNIYDEENEEWTAVPTGNGGDNRFIVTLTPTAQDYSGTMDKTVAEINTAYKAGQEIVFRVMMSETNHMDMDCTARWFDDASYPSFNAYILVSEDTTEMLVYVFTSSTRDGTKQTYHTRLYPITPLS